MSGVPEDFGLSDGTEISNKEVILKDIDKVLNKGKPPAIEYIFVLPFSHWRSSWFKWIGFAGNYYGHAAVRYTHPDTGESIVMNIEGKQNSKMVNLVPADEYIFGTKMFNSGCGQGGIYNRNMVSVRIEEYPADKIRDMDYYYRKLARTQSEKDAKFSLIFGNLWNVFAPWLPMDIAERGNCARWTSKGLKEAGVLRFSSLFPKKIWVNVFEREGLLNPDNVHVVSYRRVKHAHQTYGHPTDPYISGVAPLHPLSNLMYFNLENFANVVVEVPPDSLEAQIQIKPAPIPPSWWRFHFMNITASLFTAAVALAFFAKTKRPSFKRFKRFG